MKYISLLIFLMCFASQNGAKTYYVDAEFGNDNQLGLSPATAWQTLEKVNQVELKPGDRILFKKGLTFCGNLNISAEGSFLSPITIASYGKSTQKPIIKGEGKRRYAVRIYNSSYLMIKDLEITNTGISPQAYRCGISVESVDYGESKDITIKNLTIREVNGSIIKKDGAGCGIFIKNGGKQKRSNFRNLKIINNHILRCQRNGIIWEAYSSRSNWFPSKHTQVIGNVIEQVPGDGIVPIGCDSTRIAYNLVTNAPDVMPDSEAAAGIWPWSCDNTTIEFNEVSHQRAPWDAQGFDSDWNCTNTVIQYNYSHDNYGGLALACNNGNTNADFNIGNQNTIIRYNLSVNDGLRPRKTRGKYFSPSLHLAGPVLNTLIENNIILIHKKTRNQLDSRFLVLDDWGGFPDKTTIRNNLFFTQTPSGFLLTKSTRNSIEKNRFLGDFQLKNLQNQNFKIKDRKLKRLYRKSFKSILSQKKIANGVELNYISKDDVVKIFDDIR
ncbi:right-handed parallel beta-helix repeat-containing protein [Ornithobacterium rhinotracheale]|uniref:right-handed parallel beta-helix repeat-containing protein n=1 Tax=Ornithobacterium rhinotracheale TaxID=28251 RepID=UPI00129CC3D0|nr:right-handed parallel beta-helix repeat-containing protein [Ornithobacterium rhinotracheale]MRJ07545.1 right-handed parallel beta-helix repeat-containing protein [Ornithobacterium rhinotracheale]MRJ10818.1 right-handed parallel beta-helix repeat-containing protein [Ornithobacterium rhinotracheale]UOH78141.1 right-handed parallel beta-helix repeat-containing protein [Ornithobacterium rhinotracheale]